MPGPHTTSENFKKNIFSFLMTIRIQQNYFRQILRLFEKWPFSSRLIFTEIDKTEIFLPRPQINSKNYEK